MSFDLGFFASLPNKSDADVINCYEAVCSGKTVEWASNQSFENFLIELNSKYPKDKAFEDDSPWASAWIQSGGYCVLSMNGPLEKEANSYLGGLLFSHGLISYNPQAGAVFRGDDF